MSEQEERVRLRQRWRRRLPLPGKQGPAKDAVARGRGERSKALQEEERIGRMAAGEIQRGGRAGEAGEEKKDKHDGRTDMMVQFEIVIQNPKQ